MHTGISISYHTYIIYTHHIHSMRFIHTHTHMHKGQSKNLLWTNTHTHTHVQRYIHTSETKRIIYVMRELTHHGMIQVWDDHEARRWSWSHFLGAGVLVLLTLFSLLNHKKKKKAIREQTKFPFCFTQVCILFALFLFFLCMLKRMTVFWLHIERTGKKKEMKKKRAPIYVLKT